MKGKTMNLCEDGHREVCYESRDCPACAIKDELAVTEDQLSDEKSRADDMRQQRDDLQTELDGMKAGNE